MSSVTQRLVFDPTDADSLASSHNVGAFVRAGTDGDLIDSKNIGSTEWLQVASALFDGSGVALDSVDESGVQSLAVSVQGSVTVDATDLDIRSLDHTSGGANDSVRLGDGTSFLTSTTEGADIGLDVYIINPSLEVTATDLDIRDLTAASDSVASWTNDGAGTAITSTVNGGDTGLDVNVINPGDIDIDDDLADTAIANTATAVSTAAVAVVSSALAARKWLWLANEGNKSLYWGVSGVTTANGFPLHPGMQHCARIGPAVAPEIIGRTGASAEDLRVMELS